MREREKKPRKTPKSYANIFKTLESSTTLQALSQGTPRETETHKLGKFHAQRAPDSSLKHIWKKAREVSRSSMRTQKRACPEQSPAAPPPSPPLLGLCGSAESPPFHREGTKLTTYTYANLPFFFCLFVFCGRSSTPTSHDCNQPGRERRAASEAKSRVGGSGRKPAPLRAPRHPRGEGQRLCRQAERRDSPLGEREMPPPALGLLGPDSSAAPARPPGAAAAAARGGGVAEPGASSQLAKKVSPRQSCLTIKGARPRHS